MKHRYKDIPGSRREFVVEIPFEEVKRRLDRIYEEISQTAHIPGFRKGKIPRDLLEKYHGETARERVLSDLVSDSYRKVVKESNTIPVGLPQISEIEFKEANNVSYKATVDIRPKIDLKNYKNIKIKRKLVEIKDEDIERYLSAFQESYAQFKAVEDRPAKLGDYLICDVVCEVDGKPIYKEQKNIWFLLDKNHSIPELVDDLVGALKGDKKEIKATLPENTGEPKIPHLRSSNLDRSAVAKKSKAEKKRAVFKVKVNLIKEKHLPEINDEFVKELGTYQNLAQLREAARKDLIRKQQNRIRADMSNQILEQLLKDSHFSPPNGLVDQETEILVQEAKEELRRKNKSEEDIKKRDAEFRKSSQDKAIERVRLFFILDEIAKIENIDVSDNEINETLNILAQQSNASKEELKKYYMDNNLLTSLKNQLRESKIIEFLLNNAEIKEK